LVLCTAVQLEKCLFLFYEELEEGRLEVSKYKEKKEMLIADLTGITIYMY
jgi:hypothetical protein